MGPQRTPRQSARHESSPRRHPMLLRSMARMQTAPVATHADESHSFQEDASTFAAATTASRNHSIHRIQRQSSPEISDSFSFADLIAAPSRVCGSQSHIHQESSSSSSSANAPPLSENNSSRDPSNVLINSSGKLPLKPAIPVELMTLFDQSTVGYLEMFDTRSRRLFDEQKATLEFTQEHISLMTQQCIDLQEIIRLKNHVRKLELCCPFCQDLAWNPHVCVPTPSSKSSFLLMGASVLPVGTPFAQGALAINDNNLSLLVGYFIAQHAVERIAAELDIVSPPLHSLTWPERH
ncbi:hypothetical protein F5879DRAFT_986917 [Lentinula edodes]|nr:hypothetical protein F5879DRAFT_986917 [Lentinula edodes]